MRRKISSWLLTAILLATVSSAAAQQPKKVPRIGYLVSSDPATESARSEGIRLALRERGHIDGQNIAIEYRYAEGKLGRSDELAAELVRLRVDMIVVSGGARVIQLAKNATKTIPIVMGGTLRSGRSAKCSRGLYVLTSEELTPMTHPTVGSVAPALTLCHSSSTTCRLNATENLRHPLISASCFPYHRHSNFTSFPDQFPGVTPDSLMPIRCLGRSCGGFRHREKIPRGGANFNQFHWVNDFTQIARHPRLGRARRDSH